MSPLRILITGAGGMLGSDLAARLQKSFETFGVGDCEAPHLSIPYERVDLSVPEVVNEVMEKVRPHLVFHTAAMTDVDGCETNHPKAYRLNVEMTKSVVTACNRCGAFLVFFTTDYVFDGRRTGEYSEEDQPSPLNYYGETKLLAENYICGNTQESLIFRLSWLYGLYGKSFPRKILENAKSGHPLRVVSDQVGRPTYSWDVAEALATVLEKGERAFHHRRGEIYNLANQGSVSWYDFGKHLLEVAGFAGVDVQPISSRELDRIARRPSNSVLSLTKIERDLGILLRPWEEAIKFFVERLRESKEVQANHG